MYNIRLASLISTLLMTFLNVSASVAKEISTVETNIKKQVDSVYNISKFVTWPHYVMNQNNLLFCFHDEKINENAYQTLNGKSLHQRKIRVVHLRSLEEVENCQLVFTRPLDEKNLKALTKVSQENAILTISAQKDFTENGGMIYLNIKKNKMTLKINQSQIEASDLFVRSSLLNVSHTEDDE